MKKNLWKDIEMELLKKHWYDSSKKEILNLFPLRSWGSIRGKAGRLKLYKKSLKGKVNGMFGVHRFGKDNPHYGHHLTEEQKENIRRGREIGQKKHKWNIAKGKEHWNWKGRNTANKRLLKKDWFEIAKIARQRDKYICQYCGQSPAYDVHHIIPYRLTQDDSLENLITICRNCHPLIESITNYYLKENKNPIELFYEKWSQ